MPYKAKSKTFLTDHPEEFGSVAWKVKVDESWDNSKVVYAELRLTDCVKYINLDFEFNHKSFNKRLAKLEVLIDELHDFRHALQLAAIEMKPTKVY